MEQRDAAGDSPRRLAPPVASRALAMVHSAIYDAVNAIEGSPTLYTAESAAPGASPAAALAAAAHRVLAYLYPVQQTSLDAALATSLAQLATALPRRPASRWARRSGTRSSPCVPRRLGPLRHVRRRTGGGTVALHGTDVRPRLVAPVGHLDPFTLDSASQFRPDGPPGLTSQAYADAFNEVKELGGATGSTRTAEQTQIARFWAEVRAATRRRATGTRSPSRSPRTTGTACWRTPASSPSSTSPWPTPPSRPGTRSTPTAPGGPITAIRRRISTATPTTEAQADWQPFLITPNFPEYISGHSTFSAARPRSWPRRSATTRHSRPNRSTLPGVDRTFDELQCRGGGGGPQPDLWRHPLRVLQPGRPGDRAESGRVGAAIVQHDDRHRRAEDHRRTAR